MKKLLLPLAIAFAANSAYAAQFADLTVTGTITPPSCDVTMANSGAIDYGDILGQDLDETQATTLAASAPQNLSIICGGATVIGFKILDNQTATLPAGSASSETAFGLGEDAATTPNPIGSYAIQANLATTMIDSGSGPAVGYILEGIAQAGWADVATSTTPLKKNDSVDNMYAFNTAAASATPLAITSAVVPLSIVPTIEPTDNLDTSADIMLNGSATIELVYL